MASRYGRGLGKQLMIRDNQVIKLYAWEPPMEGVISSLRDRELSLIRKAAALRTFSDMLNSASPFLVGA